MRYLTMSVRALAIVTTFTIATLPAYAESEASQPLTNADVVKLSSLGLGDEVVIAKIKQAPKVSFALEISDLERLQQQGVSKPVIAAMLNRAATAASSESSATNAEVWAVSDGLNVEIPSVAGYVEASIGQAFKQELLFSFKNKMAISAHGTAAKIRFKVPPTVLFTRYRPSEIGVALLLVDAEKDKRYIAVVSRVGSNAGEFYPPENDMKFTDERMKDGTYKLTFKKPLLAGEYGLIAAEGKTGYVVHDFAVDQN